MRRPGEQYVLPGFFVNKVTQDGKQDLQIWNLKVSENPLYSRYRGSTAYTPQQISFELWAKIFSKYGILPVSATNSIEVHDLFGHAFAAIVHPFEELVLTRRSYDRFLQELDGYEGAARERYIHLQFEDANILFEALKTPKGDTIQSLKQ